MRPESRGFALATTMWWIFGVSAFLLIAFSMAVQKSRWEQKIHEGTDHFYLAEGILAQEVNRLKASSWSIRWYNPPARTPAVPGAVAGQTILGTFPRTGAGTASGPAVVAEFSGYVQDVVDFWSDSAGQKILPGHTDIFLEVKYPVHVPPDPAAPPPETRAFFYRVVFRQPSSERPTATTTRRFTGVPAFDPRTASGRAAVLCKVNEAERLREDRRPESNVIEREVRQLARLGASPSQIARALCSGAAKSRPERPWSLFATAAIACENEGERHRERERSVSDVFDREVRGRGRQNPGEQLAESLQALGSGGAALERQIAMEGQMLDLLKEGQLALETPGRIFAAKDAFARALELARQQDRANRSYSTPLCLYALGRGEWMFARTLRHDDPAEDAERRAMIDTARTRFQEIVRDFPWEGMPPPGPPNGTFPDRLEAPHAFVPLALTLVNKADPGNAREYNKAIENATELLEELRRAYPYFHLWGEDAITGVPHEGPSTRSDEVVWYLEQLLPMPVFIFGGANGLIMETAIQRFSPQAGWFVVNNMLVGLHYSCVVQLKPRRGAIAGGQFMVLGGLSANLAGFASVPPYAEIYDAVLNTVREPKSPSTWPDRFFETAVLQDGRMLVAGWSTYVFMFDPATETFSVPGGTCPTGRTVAGGKFIGLRDGRALLVGANYSREFPCPTDTGYVYDPRTSIWRGVRNRLSGGPGAPDRTSIAATEMLEDGSVLIVQNPVTRGGVTYNPIDLYLPDANAFWPGNPPADPTWIGRWGAPPMGRMNAIRTAPWTCKLPTGRVLIGNGYDARGSLLSTESYDPVTRQFTVGPDTLIDGTQAGLLPGGLVFLLGQIFGTGKSQIFDPSGVDSRAVDRPPLPVFGASFLCLSSRP